MHDGSEGRVNWKADGLGSNTDSSNVTTEAPHPTPAPEASQHAVHSEHTVRGGYIRFQAQFAPRFYSLLTELCAAKHFQKTVKT